MTWSRRSPLNPFVVFLSSGAWPSTDMKIFKMLNLGTNWGGVHWPDNWTATTTDGKRSAQFEDTLLYVLCDLVSMSNLSKVGFQG